VRWYAVQTLVHREFGASNQLVAQGYHVYLPHHLKTIRHARCLRTVNAPFFPQYLFVHLDISRDRWLPINGTFGVARIIMGRDRPLPVPVGVVEALQSRLDRQSARHDDGDLRLGDRVEVMVGPFANFVGVLERLDGAKRVRVLLELMGTVAPVTLDRHAVVAINGRGLGGSGGRS